MGIVGSQGDVENSNYDLQLRPIDGLYMPVIPVYARAIFAYEILLHEPHAWAIGGAAGIKIGLPFIGLGLFAEVGVLPQFVKVNGSSPEITIVEGRLGAYWAF